MNAREYWLEVEHDDLRAFDEQLSCMVTEQPNATVPLLEAAAQEVARESAGTAEAMPEIQVRATHLRPICARIVEQHMTHDTRWRICHLSEIFIDVKFRPPGGGWGEVHGVRENHILNVW